jgi:hypothetical protein
MNRKQFLKSLLVIPALVLLGINKDKDIIEYNPYKLRFVNSKDRKISIVLRCTNIKYNSSYHNIKFRNGHYIIENENYDEKIISLVGYDFYNICYIEMHDSSDYAGLNMLFHPKNKYRIVITGHELDWWLPVKYIESKKQYVIDTDIIKNKSTCLTTEDQKIIRSFLNHGKKGINKGERKCLELTMD